MITQQIRPAQTTLNALREGKVMLDLAQAGGLESRSSRSLRPAREPW